MKITKWLVLIGWMITVPVTAEDFRVQVSTEKIIPNIVKLITASSTMQTQWFVDREGGRTVYSHDVYIGDLIHGQPPQLYAHATWVINYTAYNNTVNLKKGKTHITNWLGNQRCNVYEDGTCNCHDNPNWNICAYPPLADYVTALVAYARGAAINAKYALEAAGYNVTRNP